MTMLFFQGLHLKNQENLPAKKKKRLSERSTVQSDSFKSAELIFRAWNLGTTSWAVIQNYMDGVRFWVVMH